MTPSFIAGSTSRIYGPPNAGSGGGLLSAPTNVQLILQGQDSQEASLGIAWPSQPNHQTVGWKSVSGAVSYNVYRSTDRGTYSFYANVSAATAATAYSSYVSGSGTNDYQTNIDCAYQDTAATNCTVNPGRAISNADNGTVALGLLSGTQHGYTYKVSAVNGSGEGTLSTDCIAIFFAGGLKIMNQVNGLFNGSLVYNDATAPATSPLGNTVNALMTTNSTVGTFINPFSGGGGTDFNVGVKGYNYFVINVLANQAGSSFSIAPEVAGDTLLLPAAQSYAVQSTAYGTLVSGSWVTLKIPLADIQTDGLWGTGLEYFAFYKITLDTHTNNQKYWMEWYFSVN